MGRIESRDVAAFYIVSILHFIERGNAAYTGQSEKCDNYRQEACQHVRHLACLMAESVNEVE